MILKTKCDWADCDQNIEFDETQLDKKCVCPHSNRETCLSVNNDIPNKHVFTFVNSIVSDWSLGGELTNLRNNTYYRKTRTFIKLVQYLHYLAALAAILLVVGYLLSVGWFVSPMMYLVMLGSVGLGVVIFIFFGSLWKEVASLLVDIADVQMSVYKNRKS